MKRQVPLILLVLIAAGALGAYGWSRRGEKQQDQAMRESGAEIAQLNASFVMGDVRLARATLSRRPEFRDMSDWLSNSLVLRQTSIVRLLLEQGSDPDGLNNDGSPLVNCGRVGNLAAARVLLKAGANVNARSKDGFTPLMQTSREGLTQMARVLLERGAKVNALAEPPGGAAAAVDHDWQEDRTALQIAVRFNRPEMVELLLEHGADPTIRTRLGETPLALAKGLGRKECEELLERSVRNGPVKDRS